MIEAKKYLVYALLDPVSSTVKYIGKSSYGVKRPKEHIYKTRELNKKDHCHNWIRSIKTKGLTPVIKILESFDNIDPISLYLKEQYYIKLYKDLGYRLTNSTDGGPGLVNPSAEVRQKISDKGKNRRCSAATIELKRLVCPTKKQVIRNDGVIFSSITEAARKSNTSRKGVCQVLKNKTHTANGYGFKYFSGVETGFPVEPRNSKIRLRKPVIRNDGACFKSISEAAKSINGLQSNICAVLKGLRNHHKSYSFKYLEVK